MAKKLTAAAYPAIPEPYQDVASLQATVKALKEAVEMLTGQRGPVDVSLPGTFTDLVATFEGSEVVTKARITEIYETVANEDLALAQKTLLLEANLKTSESELKARLTQVDEARVTADEAIARQVLTLEAEVDAAADGAPDLKSKLIRMDQARATAEEAAASSVRNLTASLDSKERELRASIEQELLARVRGDEATAQLVTALRAQVQLADATITSSINQEIIARSNADGALASQISTLQANYQAGDSAVAALVNQEIVARANADNALAAMYGTLQTSLNGNNATLNTVANSVNGISVKFGVAGYINGQTGGFVFAGVLKNDGSVVYDMEINSNLRVRGDLVVDGTLVYNKFPPSGLSNVATAEGGHFSGTGATAYIQARAGGRLVILVNFRGQEETHTPQGQLLEVLIGGQFYQYLLAQPIKATDSSGDHYLIYPTTDTISYPIYLDGTYAVTVRQDQGGFIFWMPYVKITVLEFAR